MDEVRKIFRSFSQMDGFDGWVIGKLRFQFGQWDNGTKRKQASVRKHKENYALLETVSSHVSVQMHILKSRRGSLEEETRNAGKTHQKLSQQRGRESGFVSLQQHLLLGRKKFSGEEIFAFVDDVGDDNWIHRTERPVVPGGLIAEWLWEEGLLWNREEVLAEEGQAEEKIVAVDIRFQAPFYAGEEMAVYQDIISGQLFGVVRRASELVLLWKGKRLDG